MSSVARLLGWQISQASIVVKKLKEYGLVEVRPAITKGENPKTTRRNAKLTLTASAIAKLPMIRANWFASLNKMIPDGNFNTVKHCLDESKVPRLRLVVRILLEQQDKSLRQIFAGKDNPWSGPWFD